MVSIETSGGSRASRTATFTMTAVHGTQVWRPVNNVVAIFQSSFVPGC
ncbi:hypothetical protein MSIMFB_02624 [Mycobacterium simulans]|uniref:Uncharacterized protein n=1 Tax=Mycobacterium simulans TaxID=627089 RepID=A0A7Z7IMT9_9MYCO|nr:hypothetical protein MSIMFB_02624 [Mycobacterium simulans]